MKRCKSHALQWHQRFHGLLCNSIGTSVEVEHCTTFTVVFNSLFELCTWWWSLIFHWKFDMHLFYSMSIWIKYAKWIINVTTCMLSLDAFISDSRDQTMHGWRVVIIVELGVSTVTYSPWKTMYTLTHAYTHMHTHTCIHTHADTHVGEEGRATHLPLW